MKVKLSLRASLFNCKILHEVLYNLPAVFSVGPKKREKYPH